MAGYCGNCGETQQEGERFCRNCGKPFATEEASSPSPLGKPIAAVPVEPAAGSAAAAPAQPPAAGAPPLTQAPGAKKAAKRAAVKAAEGKPAKAGQKRKTSPLLMALVALGACLACVWFGGKALLERWGPGSFRTSTATPETSQAVTLAVAREVIGPEGGTVALDTGIKLIFPAGALGSKTEVVIKQLDAARFTDENTEAVLLDCSAGVSTFEKPVAFHIPLPSWFTPADADAVLAGVWDETTGAVQVEPSTVVMVGGKPELVIEADHFSWHIVEWWKQNYAMPPNQADTLEVPYYGQSGGYCWAAVLQMLNESARHSFTSEVFSVIGRIGVDDAGLRADEAKDFPSVGALVLAQTNTEPERVRWRMGNDSPMLTYIRRQLACFKRPVALIYGGHAVIFVGYNGTNFTVHDPQGLTGDIYKLTKFEGLGTTWGEEETTIVLAATLATDRPLVTVNIKDKALTFVKPGTATPSDQIEFTWDYTVGIGYTWFSKRLGAAVAAIPAETSKLKIALGGENGVEIANSHLKAAVDVTVHVDIYSHGPGKTHYSDQTTMRLAPGEAKALKVDEIPVSAFRDPSPSAVDYTLEIRTVVGGKTVDEARVDFVLEPGPTPTPTATEKVVPTDTVKAEAGVTPGQGEWVLQAIVPYVEQRENSKCYFDNKVSLGDGSCVSSGSWTDSGGCVSGSDASGSIHCACTWGAPPSYLKVGSTLSMEMTCRATASQTAGYKNSGAQGMIYCRVNPPPEDLVALGYGSRRILNDVLATGPSNEYPKTASKTGSVEVPAGSKGDVLVIAVYSTGQGGRGNLAYKYAYHGTDPVPERGVPAEGLTPQAAEPSATATTQRTATPTATLEPTDTPEPEVAEEPQATPTEEYGAGERDIWDISNGYLVYNGAGAPTKFTITRHWLITRIINYHWNDAKGVEPGWIALRADDGTMYGPWWAVGQDGYMGVRNANWLVTPNTVIPAGTYTVIDSDPMTWSQNELTESRGFSWGYGIPR